MVYLPKYEMGCRRMTSAQTRCLQALRVFREAQVRRRDWICFSEIVDWYIEYQSSQPRPDQERNAIEGSGLRATFFERTQWSVSSRGQVARMVPQPQKFGSLRVTPQVTTQALSISRGRSEEIEHRIFRSGLLDHWWIGRKDFIRWLKEHHLPISPPRFEPQPGNSYGDRLLVKKPARG